MNHQIGLPEANFPGKSFLAKNSHSPARDSSRYSASPQGMRLAEGTIAFSPPGGVQKSLTPE